MAVSTSRAERSRTARAAAPAERRFRTDIQAMRALAVGLVVLNHLWPLRLPGGYVGVDVFFVISGFLISSHLVREIDATGKVRLAAFYARRARRLFPAAFLVLAATMVLALAFLPYPRWIGTAQEILASIFYGENWLLAAKSVDYSALTESASPVQHYWSLSVEEQFYLLWPLTLVFFAFLARRRRLPVRRVLLTAVLGVAVVFLTYSIYVTAASPEQAYFVTPARVWEFAVGAAVGLAAAPFASLVFRNILAVAGFGLILGSALVFDGSTPFPGWTALAPVLGSAMVILAGNGGGRLLHDRLTSLPPVQFAGKISYSLYLWHWPLIVAAPYVFREVPTAPYKLLILGMSLLLAWLTKRWVEDAWIKTRGRHSRRALGFRAPMAGMAAVAVAAVLLGATGSAKENHSAQLAAAGSAGPCYGAAALETRDCGDPFGIPVALPHMGADNMYGQLPAECPDAEDKLSEGGGPRICDFSGGNPDAETAWLVGDSHGQQWLQAVVEVARDRGWVLKLTYRGGCPMVDARIVSFSGAAAAPDAADQCSTWVQTATDAIVADRPDLVFVSTFVSAEEIDDGTGDPQNEQYVRALTRIWQRWTDAGTTVVPITDAPLNAAVRSPDCIALNAAEPLACAVPREAALGIDPLSEAAKRMASDKVKPLDLTDSFCDRQNCYAAVGGVAVYYDPNHLNGLYVRQLAPRFAAVLD